jgi:hypothetical protein
VVLKTENERLKGDIEILGKSRVKSIEVKPGAVLVIEVDRVVSSQESERLRDQIKGIYPADWNVRGLLFSGGLRLAAVLTPAADEVCKGTRPAVPEVLP